MTNDNHANYAKIGLTVVLGIVAILGALIYIGGIHDDNSEVLFETYYDKSVNGLSVGSPVNFRGVKIGEVREIAFVGSKYDVQGADNARIYILMAVSKDMIGYNRKEFEDDATLLRFHRHMTDKLGLRATVTASGITGLSRIEWDTHTENPPEAKPLSWTPKHYYIPPKNSLLDSFGDSATTLLNEINKMDFNAIWSNMNSIVVSIEAMSTISRNLLESRQAEFDKIMIDTSAAATAAKECLEKLRDNPSLIIRDTYPQRLPETTK